MELYKKHRPKDFRRILGNEETVNSLKNMVARDTLPHTILFSGPSGCGKTTLARILRKMLNCGETDFFEWNCSAKRGIEDVRDVQRTMNMHPTGGDVRIYLMDECHMLTKEAQNAALKMLEDTPSHVFFFLCTTDPQKLLKTIQTRCCDMPVRLLTYDEIEKLIKRTAKREDIKLSEKVLNHMVDSSQGSARTALVLLDKISNLEPDEQIQAIEDKIAQENEAIDLCRVLMKKGAAWPSVTKILKNLKGEPESTRYAVMGYARAVLIKSSNHKAYSIICAFEEPFFNSKNAGLIRACFEVMHGS